MNCTKSAIIVKATLDQRSTSKNAFEDEVHSSACEVVVMGTQMAYIKGFAAAFFYGSCSVLMAFLNKILMDMYGFHFPMCIMVVQMSLTVVILYALRATQLILIPPYTFKDGRLFLLPAAFYAANSVLGLFSLSHMNVAMYGVLKRCVPLATLILSVVLLRKSWPSFLTLISVIFLTVGCIIAGHLAISPIQFYNMEHVLKDIFL
eukprot:XP_014773518.1 PREDICTED: UDP-N-acetylglucosamine/UDP-glucose/GDP-mannose transporter-like [Octopus bimaculoides]